VIKAEFSSSLLQSSVSQMLPLISLICWFSDQLSSIIIEAQCYNVIMLGSYFYQC